MIGTGYMSGLHLQALGRLGRTVLVGVVSRDPSQAADVAARWGGRGYTDGTAMLDEARPDLAGA
jgi:predicted dehydrogenase